MSNNPMCIVPHSRHQGEGHRNICRPFSGYLLPLVDEIGLTANRKSARPEKVAEWLLPAPCGKNKLTAVAEFLL